MRYAIWEKDDFFMIGGERIDMDPAVVKFGEESLALVWNFDFEKPPVGRVTDLRLEEGEIAGEVHFFDENLRIAWEDIKRDFRLGGYYHRVTQKRDVDGGNIMVMDCTLQAVGIILKNNMPGFPKAL